jgi:peptidoglycan-associated lipoprotein
VKPWDALCWAVLALGLVIACTQPKPPPAPPPEAPRDFGEGSATEYVEQLERRGQALEGFAQGQVPQAIYFPLNSAELVTPDAYVLARHLSRTGQAVRLEGHACPLGDDAYNEALSYHRAMAVRAALVAGGVLGGRIEVVSYGETRPATLDPGVFEVNRRVEVKLQ